MMISPESFGIIHENDSLEECYRIRRELMEDIIEYEDNKSFIEARMLPSPETVYNINNLYLIEICRLIREKRFDVDEG